MSNPPPSVHIPISTGETIEIFADELPDADVILPILRDESVDLSIWHQLICSYMLAGSPHLSTILTAAVAHADSLPTTSSPDDKVSIYCAQAANLVEQAARIRDRKVSQENRRKDLLFQQANEQLNKCDKLSSLNDKVWAGRGNLFLNGNDEMLFGGEASKTDVRKTTNSLEVSV